MPQLGKYTIWLVVWLPFFIFPYIGNNHPNWLSYFSEGWPNHQPAIHGAYGQGKMQLQIMSACLSRVERLLLRKDVADIAEAADGAPGKLRPTETEGLVVQWSPIRGEVSKFEKLIEIR